MSGGCGQLITERCPWLEYDFPGGLKYCKLTPGYASYICDTGRPLLCPLCKGEIRELDEWQLMRSIGANNV